MENRKILEIKDLTVRFYTYEGVVKAIDDVSLYLNEKETLCLVGETGCGKSVTVLSSLVLTPPPGRIEHGDVFLRINGDNVVNLLKLNEKDLLKIRGKYISIIFQEPGVALNPVYTIGDQIAEALLVHRKKYYAERVLKKLENEMSGKKSLFKKYLLNIEFRIYRNYNSRVAGLLSKIPVIRRFKRRLENEVKEDAVELLRDMEIADPERVVGMYPHELSGGMKQRAVIAMALASNPMILIADEPTTNLDVTVQAQILDLIRRLKKKYSSSVIYITHDMGVVAEMCSRVAVMYAGNIVEVADIYELFKNPLHPYTKALLESIPRAGKEFKSIPGTVPNLVNPPSGCRFHPRCKYAMDICTKEKPMLKEIKPGHYVACHLYK